MDMIVPPALPPAVPPARLASWPFSGRSLEDEITFLERFAPLPWPPPKADELTTATMLGELRSLRDLLERSRRDAERRRAAPLWKDLREWIASSMFPSVLGGVVDTDVVLAILIKSANGGRCVFLARLYPVHVPRNGCLLVQLLLDTSVAEVKDELRRFVNANASHVATAAEAYWAMLLRAAHVKEIDVGVLGQSVASMRVPPSDVIGSNVAFGWEALRREAAFKSVWDGEIFGARTDSGFRKHAVPPYDHYTISFILGDRNGSGDVVQTQRCAGHHPIPLDSICLPRLVAPNKGSMVDNDNDDNCASGGVFFPNATSTPLTEMQARAVLAVLELTEKPLLQSVATVLRTADGSAYCLCDLDRRWNPRVVHDEDEMKALAQVRGGVVKMPTGSGKSLAALVAVQERQRRDEERPGHGAANPCLIVVPTPLLRQWQSEAEKHDVFPGRRASAVVALHKAGDVRGAAKRAWSSLRLILAAAGVVRTKAFRTLVGNKGFRLTIVDEAQDIVSMPKTLEAILSFSHDAVVALTATPEKHWSGISKLIGVRAVIGTATGAENFQAHHVYDGGDVPSNVMVVSSSSTSGASSTCRNDNNKGDEDEAKTVFSSSSSSLLGQKRPRSSSSSSSSSSSLGAANLGAAPEIVMRPVRIDPPEAVGKFHDAFRGVMANERFPHQHGRRVMQIMERVMAGGYLNVKVLLDVLRKNMKKVVQNEDGAGEDGAGREDFEGKVENGGGEVRGALRIQRLEHAGPSVKAAYTEKAEECGVCMLAFSEPAQPPCGHVFCGECLESLVRITGKCPNCRAAWDNPLPVVVPPAWPGPDAAAQRKAAHEAKRKQEEEAHEAKRKQEEEARRHAAEQAAGEAARRRALLEGNVGPDPARGVVLVPGKQEAVEQELRAFADSSLPGKKLILFTKRDATAQTYVDMASRHVGADSVVTAGVLNTKRRQSSRNIESFKHDESCQVLVLNYNFNTGFDLGVAPHMIVPDFDVRSTRLKQAVGRITRIGRRHPRIVVTVLLYRDCLDDLLFRAAFEKYKMAVPKTTTITKAMAANVEYARFASKGGRARDVAALVRAAEKVGHGAAASLVVGTSNVKFVTDLEGPRECKWTVPFKLGVDVTAYCFATHAHCKMPAGVMLHRATRGQRLHAFKDLLPKPPDLQQKKKSGQSPSPSKKQRRR